MQAYIISDYILRWVVGGIGSLLSGNCHWKTLRIILEELLEQSKKVRKDSPGNNQRQHCKIAKNVMTFSGLLLLFLSVSPKKLVKT